MAEPDASVASSTTEPGRAIAQVASDSSGAETFDRYVWQAKQAVRQWLTCLAEDGPRFVLCEHVEDLVLAYVDRTRFLQLKTRDRGSWSASSMCSRGIDALVRSYTAAREVDLHESASFELWLEGPISEVKATVLFVRNPRTADPAIRKRVIDLGLKSEWIDDFLRRLVIRPDQPSRSHIDAVVMWEIGALWPGLVRADQTAVFDRLLSAATAAQAAGDPPGSVQAHLAAALPNLDRTSPSQERLGEAWLDPVRNQMLSPFVLSTLTPPRPDESREQLLGRLADGVELSMMELKLRAAGAGEETLRRARQLRADMEVQRQLLLSGSTSAEADLDGLAERLLMMAEAAANRLALSSGINPAAAARSAEALTADLLSRPADLAACDRRSLFGADPKLVYGYLGHLSDECRFAWRAP